MSCCSEATKHFWISQDFFCSKEVISKKILLFWWGSFSFFVKLRLSSLLIRENAVYKNNIICSSHTFFLFSAHVGYLANCPKADRVGMIFDFKTETEELIMDC
jgi:hypothetical protein